MDRDEIVVKMTEIFRHVFEDENLVLSDDMTPDTVENWASLTHMQMVTALQESFGVKFSIRDQLRLMKVYDIISLLQEKLA